MERGAVRCALLCLVLVFAAGAACKKTTEGGTQAGSGTTATAAPEKAAAPTTPVEGEKPAAGEKAAEGQPAEGRPASAGEKPAEGPATEGRPVEAGGQLKVAYADSQNETYAAMATALKDTKVFEAIANELNEAIKLPVDLPISFEECGQINALYDPNARKIMMCYELLDYLARSFEGSEEEMASQIGSTAIFVTLHELGHGLIDLLQLPITGREEDVADQLATWVMLESADEGEAEDVASAVLTAAVWFAGQADTSLAAVDIPFWDVHPVEQQRFYNIVCWAYGWNAEKTAAILGDALDQALPEERRESCAEEYGKLSTALATLLAPHLRRDQEGAAGTASAVPATETAPAPGTV
jgi:hypothetical protein